MDKSILTYVAVLMALLCLQTVSSAKETEPETEDPCDPNPCYFHGVCQWEKDGNATCQCYSPSSGPKCETVGGFLKADWLLSLAFSLPIAALLLLSVVLFYCVQGRKREADKHKNELEIDYDPPSVVTNPHASPIDTVPYVVPDAPKSTDEGQQSTSL